MCGFSDDRDLDEQRNFGSLPNRSHCLFTVVIESTSSSSIRDTDPDVRRGKLVLVDLAGSESLKKVMAVQEANEELRRKQAIGINKVLTHLGAVVNNLNAGYENSTGFRNSALTMLLRDCLGGGARALLVANIGPEADWSSETAMTLRFAQKMMKVKNVEQKVVIDASQSLGSMLCYASWWSLRLSVLCCSPFAGQTWCGAQAVKAWGDHPGARLYTEPCPFETLPCWAPLKKSLLTRVQHEQLTEPQPKLQQRPELGGGELCGIRRALRR
eukprot:s6040_g3.t1